MLILSQVLRVPRNFEIFFMIGLDQEDEIEEITSRCRSLNVLF